MITNVPARTMGDSVMRTHKGREELIDLVRSKCPSWQNVKTPHWVGMKMASMLGIPESEKNDYIWVVMFATEILDAVTFGLTNNEFIGPDPKNVLFVADSKAEAIIAETVYHSDVLRIDQGCDLGMYMKVLKCYIDNMPANKKNKIVVLGNPPYQEQAAGDVARSKPLYNKFITTAIDVLKPDYVSMITPSRWMQGGLGLDEFRTRMMNDKHLKAINHYPGDREVFPSVSIKGGVNYFLWDSSHNGTCNFNGNERDLSKHDIILIEQEPQSILKKVQSKIDTFMDKVVSSRNPFGLETNHSTWSESGVPCIVRGKTTKNCKPELFSDRAQILDKWKVCFSKAGDGGSPDKNGKRTICNGMFLIEPGTICTGTYMVANAFDTEQEANNFKSYFETKFFRFMLSLRVTSQDVTKDKFAWVPDMQDYSVVWTDEMLKEKFDITDEECKYFESKIK